LRLRRDAKKRADLLAVVFWVGIGGLNTVKG
jgi:hypothetical protein